MSRVSATVLRLDGDQAEVAIPDRRHGAEAPLRVPVADLTGATGLPADRLPGLDLTVEAIDGTLGLTLSGWLSA